MNIPKNGWNTQPCEILCLNGIKWWWKFSLLFCDTAQVSAHLPPRLSSSSPSSSARWRLGHHPPSTSTIATTIFSLFPPTQPPQPPPCPPVSCSPRVHLHLHPSTSLILGLVPTPSSWWRSSDHFSSLSEDHPTPQPAYTVLAKCLFPVTHKWTKLLISEPNCSPFVSSSPLSPMAVALPESNATGAHCGTRPHNSRLSQLNLQFTKNMNRFGNPAVRSQLRHNMPLNGWYAFVFAQLKKDQSTNLLVLYHHKFGFEWVIAMSIWKLRPVGNGCGNLRKPNYISLLSSVKFSTLAFKFC